MAMLTGAILVLAGAILFGAAVVGHEVCIAANRFPDAATGWGFLLGSVLGVIGLLMVLSGAANRHTDRPPVPPP